MNVKQCLNWLRRAWAVLLMALSAHVLSGCNYNRACWGGQCSAPMGTASSGVGANLGPTHVSFRSGDVVRPDDTSQPTYPLSQPNSTSAPTYQGSGAR